MVKMRNVAPVDISDTLSPYWFRCLLHASTAWHPKARGNFIKSEPAFTPGDDSN